MIFGSCIICKRTVLDHCYKIRCSTCLYWCHRNCLPLYTNDDFEYALNSQSTWSCISCNENMFAFNMHDDDSFTAYVSELQTNFQCALNILDSKMFSPFDFDNFETEDPLNNYDPDMHFFNINSNSTLKDSQYYLHDSFIKDVEKYIVDSNMFSLFHLNIRSVNRNFKNLSYFLSTLPVSFACIGLTETWINEISFDNFHYDGYNHIGKYRENRTGGGVSILLRNTVTFQPRNDLSRFNSSFESCFIEINKSQFNTSTNIIVGVVYRIPGSDTDMFIDYYKEVLDLIKSEKKLGYIMGDFNLNLLNSESHVPTNEFIDINLVSSFVPLITRPTRITRTTSTLIDNIFTNNITCDDCFKGIFVNDISDHYPIFYVDIKSRNINKADDFFYKRVYNQNNMNKFHELLNPNSLDDIFNMSDAQEAMTVFHSKLCSSHNQAFPLIKVKKKYSNKFPWLSDSLKKAIKKKNKLYASLRKSFTKDKELYYKRYKSQLNKLLRTAEKEHITSMIDKYKGNIKKTWKLIKDVIKNKATLTRETVFEHNGETFTNPKDISEKFNNYFVNIGSTLSSKIEHVNQSPSSYLVGSYNNNLFLAPTTENEVFNVMSSLKKSSTGYDNISSDLLKTSCNIIAPYLVHIINLSFTTGVFPSELKIANVIPLFKAGKSGHFTNYRPISLLSTLSKVFEKLFYTRLYDFLTKYDILYKFQFGFQKGHSTCMALLVFLDKIIRNLENGEYAIGIFLDFSKAFDTVDHKILLQKLEFYGIRGVPLLWLSSYLNSRKQYTSYSNVDSPMQCVSCGVPQGSILGPLLFLIYVNDLAYVSKSLFTLLFADDTNCFITGRDLPLLMSKINIDLSNISTWLKSNRLSLNVDKTHFILFKPKKKKISDTIDIRIDNKLISEVSQCKFLGVIIDNKLSWEHHVLYIKKKISKVIGILYKSRDVLCHSQLLSLYKTLLEPYIFYCNIIWSGSCTYVLSPLIKVQKQAIRCICFLKRNASTQSFFKKLNVFNLSQLRIYCIDLFMFKYYHNMLPKIFDNFFIKNSSVHAFNTRQSNLFHVPIFKSNLSKSFIRYFGVLCWNNVIRNVKVDSKVSPFKKALRSFINQEY